MAKINLGPIAASVHGRLGPLVYRLTRHGQVVNVKPLNRVYTTGNGLLTKQRFARANVLYWRISAFQRNAYKTALHKDVTVQTIPWNRAIYLLQKTNLWNMSGVGNIPTSLRIVAATYDFLLQQWTLTTNLHGQVPTQYAHAIPLRPGQQGQPLFTSYLLNCAGANSVISLPELPPPLYWVIVPAGTVDPPPPGQWHSWGYGDAIWVP